MSAPDWKEIARARLRALVESLERMEPEDVAILNATPQAALLREWIRKSEKTEYDL